MNGGGKTVGYIYADNNEEIELSVGISCYYAGQGIATNSIRALVELLSVTENKNIIAYIREDNVKSQRVFEKVGFKITDQYRTMNFTGSDCAMRLYKWIYQ